MFLNKLQNDNPQLIEAICNLHQAGKILPDSYVIDLDQFKKNAYLIKKTADDNEIMLWFMLKQLGRNPALAQDLVDLGYPGAVVVDFREAQVMMRHGIPLGNVGHLVQTPQAILRQVIEYGSEFFTVFSTEKAREISNTASSLGKRQKLLLRVYDSEDVIYNGQTAGIALEHLPAFLREVSTYPGVEVDGLTSFPCFLYRESLQDISPTTNLYTVLKAREILREHGHAASIMNTPSATCVRTLELMGTLGSNCGEPGHGLTGTTPAHAVMDLSEKCCVAYVSEVSHNFSGRAYCYGGGYYRRSHVLNALVGSKSHQLRQVRVIPPSLESIDYHFGLSDAASVGDTVIMSFRFQIFVTRSDVVLLSGISQGRPKIEGIWDSQGNKKL